MTTEYFMAANCSLIPQHGPPAAPSFPDNKEGSEPAWPAVLCKAGPWRLVPPEWAADGQGLDSGCPSQCRSCKGVQPGIPVPPREQRTDAPHDSRQGLPAP